MVIRFGRNVADTMIGGTGNDELHGKAGNDVIYGKAGNDKLYGDAGNDKLYGDDGNDSIKGGIGHDRIDMGAGNDTYTEEAGNDTIYGGSGNDSYNFTAGLGGHNDIHDTSGTDSLLFRDFSVSDMVSGGDFFALDVNNNGRLDGLLFQTNDQAHDILMYNYFDDSSASIAHSHPGSGYIENIVFSDATWHFADIVAIFH